MKKINNRIFVSIGVSKPCGGLEELPGAITAAERMAVWAKAQDYETLLLHDEDLTEITVEILRDKITKVIQDVTNQTVLKRLVIFFAGHGGSQQVGDQLWLLTNWDTDWNEAIRISSLQRVLEYYGPEQVAVISDACQEVSSKFGDILGSQVLKKTDEEPQLFELDQFYAVDYGKQAFMIKAKGEEKAFCLFTEILLDALEGDAEDNCFEEINGHKVVTSDSLASYLKKSVPRIAGKYGLRMKPQPKPGFFTDKIYLTMPEPSIQMMSTSATDPEASTPIDDNSFEIELLGTTRDKRASSETRQPKKDQRPHMRSVAKIALVKPKRGKASPLRKSSDLDQARHDRQARREAFINKVGNATVRDHFETGCGLCVSGADVAAVAASFSLSSRISGPLDWYRIDLGTPSDGENLAWSDVLVTLADGRIVSVCAILNFIAALDIIDETSISLIHHPLGVDPGEIDLVINLLAQLNADLLTAKEIIDSAAMLRDDKHRIITVGCIAAQFYDAIRDVDSLRSMAAFYAMHKQPVPLDIILYGGGKINERNGRLYADIPLVAKREARTSTEESRPFIYIETPAFKGHPIAGRTPWMRQAWSAVETAQCDKSAARWQLQACTARKHLAPGVFTVAVPEGREAMFELAGIRID